MTTTEAILLGIGICILAELVIVFGIALVIGRNRNGGEYE